MGRYFRLYPVAVLLGVFFVTYAYAGLTGFEAGKYAYDKHDYATAYRELYPLAKKGDARAQRILGQMYRHGRGVQSDIVKGTSWIHRAAKQGFAPAQYDLGVIFLNMAVTKGHFAKADKWLTEAARQGHLEAQFRLGKMYRDGSGVEADDVRALVLFNAAGKKIKDARGARAQLVKRMSKTDIARAKSLGMAIFTTPPKIKTFAESKKTLKDVKGKCGVAGERLYRSAEVLENMTAKLKKCLGKEWSGDLCSSQIDDLVNNFGHFNKVASAMKNDC